MASLFYEHMIVYFAPNTLTEIPYEMLLVVLAVTDRSACDRAYRKWQIMLVAFLAVSLCVPLMATALYVSYTAVGSATISGMQHRYLYGLIYPLLAPCCNVNVVNEMKLERYRSVVYVAVAALVLFATYQNALTFVA